LSFDFFQIETSLKAQLGNKKNFRKFLFSLVVLPDAGGFVSFATRQKKGNKIKANTRS